MDMQQHFERKWKIQKKSHDDNSHFEALVLFVLYRRVAARRAFTRERLAAFIHGLRDTMAFCGFGEVVPPTECLDSIITALFRDGKVYPAQRRGERGTFEEHLLVSPFGVKWLGSHAESWMRQIHVE